MKLLCKSTNLRVARLARAASLLGALLAGACAHTASNQACPNPDVPTTFTRRPLRVNPLDSPAGMGVCYGPFRAGQAPDGAQPTPAQILEDLRLVSRHFNTIRLYSAREPTRTILRVIHDNHLLIHVLIGAWIAPEARRDEHGAVLETLPVGAAANRREVDGVIALANEFPKVVAGVIVGNETQVFWSDHRVDPVVLIGYIREVRAHVHVPVTTADDFNFWIKPESDAVAREIDYIDNHAYAMWNGVQLDDAIAFTDEKMRAVRAAHPGQLVILGETGWATRKGAEGDQAKYIKGTPGEKEQAAFYEAIRHWAKETGTIVLYFEAFDEPWKGGSNPDEVEKHWGLYNVDRTPKRALRGAE